MPKCRQRAAPAHPALTALAHPWAAHDAESGLSGAKFLRHEGHEMHGIKRRASLFYTDWIDRLYRRSSHEEGVRFFLQPDKLNNWQLLIKNYNRGITH